MYGSENLPELGVEFPPFEEGQDGSVRMEGEGHRSRDGGVGRISKIRPREQHERIRRSVLQQPEAVPRGGKRKAR